MVYDLMVSIWLQKVHLLFGSCIIWLNVSLVGTISNMHFQRNNSTLELPLVCQIFRKVFISLSGRLIWLRAIFDRMLYWYFTLNFPFLVPHHIRVSVFEFGMVFMPMILGMRLSGTVFLVWIYSMF